MNTKQTEALKLALEALEHMCMHTRAKVGYRNKLIGEAMDKAREALAEQPAQQQEPYGWKVYGVNSLFMGEFAEADAKAEAKRIGGTCITFPLYTSPPASKPWVGLTDDEIIEALNSDERDAMKIYHAIEAKLREKNTGEMK